MPHKVIANTVCLSRPHYICTSERATAHSKHVTISGHESFTGQFARPVSGDWDTRTIILAKRHFGVFSVHAAARRVDDRLRSGRAHRLQHILSEVSSFPEVDVGLCYRFSNIWIGR